MIGINRSRVAPSVVDTTKVVPRFHQGCPFEDSDRAFRVRLISMGTQQHTSEPRDRGFTLVELLVVIVILGIVSTVVVFAVGGVATSAEDAAADSDARALVTAQESYRTRFGTYTTEAELVSSGFLRSESALHDIALDVDGSYEVVAPGG